MFMIYERYTRSLGSIVAMGRNDGINVAKIFEERVIQTVDAKTKLKNKISEV